MEAATTAKAKVEDAQRERRRQLDESGTSHVPRFFKEHDGRWVPKTLYVSVADIVGAAADVLQAQHGEGP